VLVKQEAKGLHDAAICSSTAKAPQHSLQCNRVIEGVHVYLDLLGGLWSVVQAHPAIWDLACLDDLLMNQIEQR
jgi:hypothetical protein